WWGSPTEPPAAPQRCSRPGCFVRAKPWRPPVYCTRTPSALPAEACRHAISTTYGGRPRPAPRPGAHSCAWHSRVIGVIRLLPTVVRSTTGARQRSAAGRAACESDRPAPLGRIHLAINLQERRRDSGLADRGSVTW